MKRLFTKIKRNKDVFFAGIGLTVFLATAPKVSDIVATYVLDPLKDTFEGMTGGNN